MNALEMKGVSVAYQKEMVLKDVTVDIPKGKLVGIIGPNGAGKSTMIKSILNIVPRVAGSIDILGESYEVNRNKIGYVPQKEEVDWDFPTDVLDVVMMGRYRHQKKWRKASSEDRDIAMDCLKKVSMDTFAKRQINQLSGGQQQRVFLARALAQDSPIYLMDEPFTGVDAATEKAIIKLLSSMKAEGKTVIVVHHDLQTVQEYFDSVILLNQTVQFSGPTSEVFTLDNIQQTYGGALQVFQNEDNQPSVIQS
ncbi:metal ABC transporter ATP-binding protein [Halalkalibacillus halophilus]|uniref:metal ABC transporter ATP-binding protein n=1 Tax=Halalkalibacillus halophilus TaxID=392827 RepID=UPI0003F8D302|nr:metal ABC transporter ATP-binding protein [Halalkalibacillus halophilus]